MNQFSKLTITSFLLSVSIASFSMEPHKESHAAKASSKMEVQNSPKFSKADFINRRIREIEADFNSHRREIAKNENAIGLGIVCGTGAAVAGMLTTGDPIVSFLAGFTTCYGASRFASRNKQK